jgi:hypothetical protein
MIRAGMAVSSGRLMFERIEPHIVEGKQAVTAMMLRAVVTAGIRCRPRSGVVG